MSTLVKHSLILLENIHIRASQLLVGTRTYVKVPLALVLCLCMCSTYLPVQQRLLLDTTGL